MPQVTIQQAFDLALQHHQAGRLRDAEQIYRQILSQQPNHAQTLHVLGVLAHQMGRHDAAVELIQQAIAINPHFAEAHSNLGNILRHMGKLDRAMAEYHQAIALNPNYAEAHCNLGIILNDKGQLDQAIISLRQAIALKPGLPEAHNSLGRALREKGLPEQAVAACREALVLRPDYPEAQNNLATALKDLDHLDEAIAAGRQALALRPDFPEAWNNLAAILSDKALLDDAIAAYRKTIALKPDYAEAQNGLGVALSQAGRIEEAIQAFRTAIASKPDFVQAHSNLLFNLQYLPNYDSAAIAHEHRNWNRAHAQPLEGLIRPHANNRDPNRRLRIGYVSADFAAHASAYFLAPLLANHDARQVDIFCYAEVPRSDEVTDRLRQSIPHWRSTVGIPDDQLAEQIREDQIDILVDLKLHTGGNRLLVFAQKPAPVQATWLGYPGSTGLSTIDYRLSDRYLDPTGADESIYSEKTIHLPNSFWCYDPLDGQGIGVNAPPALQAGFVTFGCFNNFCKVYDRVLRVWAQLLRQIQNSRLLVLAAPGSHRQRTLNRLAEEGIDPARIEFVSRQSRRAYLELYHRIDVVLDTFPYNGHTTSLDSLWMGVPLVSLRGQTAVGRGGLSILSNIGLAELVADTPEQYVQIAVELAGDFPRLQSLRSTLRQRIEQSPLMDAPGFARNIEAAFRQMWRSWCQADTDTMISPTNDRVPTP